MISFTVTFVTLDKLQPAAVGNIPVKVRWWVVRCEVNFLTCFITKKKKHTKKAQNNPNPQTSKTNLIEEIKNAF